MHLKHRTTVGTAAMTTLLLTVGCASTPGGSGGEDEFPSGDIRLVVPWDAGGDGDLAARTLAPLMEEQLGTEIIVENRPGANGSIAFQWLKEAPADGYSMAMGSMEIATLQFQDYDVLPADYQFVGQATQSPGAVAVHADSPYETLDDLIEAAQENPDQITYGTPGTGSVWDLAAHKFMEASNTEMQDVPFDGTAPSVQAAAAGHVDATFNPIGFIGPQVDGGNLRFLAMLTEERNPDYPDVPTAMELGYDIVHSSWVGVMVPAETPGAIVQTLSDALEAAVNDEDFERVVTASSMVPTPRPFPEMDAHVLELAEESEPLFARING